MSTELRSRVLEFASRELKPEAVLRDMEGRSSMVAWTSAAKFGLHEWLIPLDAPRVDLETTAIIMEAIGEGSEDLGFALSIAAHAFGCALPICLAGSTTTTRSFLAALRTGERVGACAMTEADSGSDAFSLTTTAKRVGGDYVLDGVKLYVTNGESADVFLVYARTGDHAGPLGLSAFLVERGTEGLKIEPGPTKLGVRTAEWVTLFLEGCRVCSDARVGVEGVGGALFQEAMKAERVALSASCIGAMRASLNRCVEYVQRHERYGRSLSGFQAIAHRVVDMRVRLESGRSLLYEAIRDRGAGHPRDDLIAIAKLAICDACFQNGYDEVHLYGAAGISLHSGTSALLRNALALQSASGTPEIQRSLIARSMGLK